MRVTTPVNSLLKHWSGIFPITVIPQLNLTDHTRSSETSLFERQQILLVLGDFNKYSWCDLLSKLITNISTKLGLWSVCLSNCVWVQGFSSTHTFIRNQYHFNKTRARAMVCLSFRPSVSLNFSFMRASICNQYYFNKTRARAIVCLSFRPSVSLYFFVHARSICNHYYFNKTRAEP